jgi:hypothetical protein
MLKNLSNFAKFEVSNPEKVKGGALLRFRFYLGGPCNLCKKDDRDK